MRPEHLSASGATEESVREVLNALCIVAEPVDISFLWRPSLKDPTDEMVLEAAINGRADALLTFNERDFVGAKRFGIEVSRPGPAWRKWKEQLS